MNFKLKLFSFFTFIFFQTVIAQNTVEFLQLSGENASTQSITYAIKQDKDGNVWIGSEEGILKHNSVNYKNYNTYNGLPETLSNRTTEIFIDSKNNIWAGLEKGVCLYNKELDKFDLIQNKNNINPSLITSIDEDSEGNIWIGAFNGLWEYNTKTQELNLKKFEEPIEALTIASNKIFFGTEKGLFIYNISKNNIQEIDLDSALKNIYHLSSVRNTVYVGTKQGVVFNLKIMLNEVSFNKVLRDFKNPIKDIIAKDSESIYVATDGDGIYHLDAQNKTLNHFIQNSNNPTSISSNGIYDLELSKDGILWVATYGGGINYFNPKKLPFYKIQHQLNNINSLSNNFTRSIAKDKNNNLLLV
ncbi:hypothetical protein H9W90_09905 [Polaribacter pectinis]|uniref:Two component regulator propeller n=1 Tax=Polaribacter pectinis TaxID=2738844 RepID=A0A7G9L7B0_9FLAO|nr:two-component regulator propeller domain-containing protein [Polaribacter pectinis]QNM84509.1 hypothetical protein H9W90_09905 [Polaribacter pectinis]